MQRCTVIADPRVHESVRRPNALAVAVSGLRGRRTVVASSFQNSTMQQRIALGAMYAILSAVSSTNVMPMFFFLDGDEARSRMSTAYFFFLSLLTSFKFDEQHIVFCAV